MPSFVLRCLPAALVGCLAVVALGLVTPSPAAAHPFGDPQTIDVSSTEDGEIRLRWKAGGTDDLTALAMALGLLPEERVFLDGAVIYEDGDGDLLAASPKFADYLLERIHVTAGRACTGEVLAVDDLEADGALLAYDCGPDPASVDVRSDMLTDLHPAYQAMATGPDGQKAVYDGEDRDHAWSLTGGASGDDLGRSALVQLGSALGLLVAGGVGAAFYVRRRGRREGAATA